jgi:glycosyltransferase involved in cell wall biosynthesis
MSRAECFLFPSLFEGFGLPPVEAMRFSCPVVSSNTSAMKEVLGDAALFCDPGNADQWKAAINSICMDESLRQDLVARGHKRAASYTWRNCAEAFLTLVVSGCGKS